MAPQGLTKMIEMAQFVAFCVIKKIFSGDMPPDPPNPLICSVFLAFGGAGPRQCKRLEPPVQYRDTKVCSTTAIGQMALRMVAVIFNFVVSSEQAQKATSPVSV